jgi:hypothetical protein
MWQFKFRLCFHHFLPNPLSIIFATIDFDTKIIQLPPELIFHGHMLLRHSLSSLFVDARVGRRHKIAKLLVLDLSFRNHDGTIDNIGQARANECAYVLPTMNVGLKQRRPEWLVTPIGRHGALGSFHVVFVFLLEPSLFRYCHFQRMIIGDFDKIASTFGDEKVEILLLPLSLVKQLI